MRRGGMFGTTANTQALIPQDSDTGEVLEAKWKKWTERESIKRLVDNPVVASRKLCSS